jgi:hypothetical protein
MLSFLFALNTFIILKLDMLSWKLYVKVLSNRASFISLLALTSSWRHRKPHCATQIHIVIIPNLLFNKNCDFILHCQKWIVTHLSRVFRCFLSPKRTLGASESQVSREHCKSESRPRSHGGVRVKETGLKGALQITKIQLNCLVEFNQNKLWMHWRFKTQLKMNKKTVVTIININ